MLSNLVIAIGIILTGGVAANPILVGQSSVEELPLSPLELPSIPGVDGTRGEGKDRFPYVAANQHPGEEPQR